MSPAAGSTAAVSPVHGARGLLAAFNAAGVLGFADVHTAEAIGRIGQEPDEQVRLALALAVRALRNGSVCIDLSTVRENVSASTAGADDPPEPLREEHGCRRPRLPLPRPRLNR